MNVVLADTFFFLALLNPRDHGHHRAREFAQISRARLFTTISVFMEIADGLARSADRVLFRRVLDDFEANPNNILIWPDESLIRRAMALYDARPDKQWSLTDCISFTVMEHQGISQALTADHHFEQADFVALFKE